MDYEDKNTDEAAPPAEEAAVTRLISRIRTAREKWTQQAFKRIKENMDFAAGIQWAGQKGLRSEKYVVNLTLRNVNQKVSTLYARNPVAEFQRRKRLDYQLYDGKLESIIPLVQQATASGLALAGIPPEARATLFDFMAGMSHREMVDRVGKTLEILYQWSFDEHDPDMKEQMKALVRRVVTCGVGYVRVGFERDVECMITSEGVGNSQLETIKRIKFMLDKVEEGEIDRDSAQMEDLRQLLHSFGAVEGDLTNQMKVSEKLIFDCLRPTSVIPDDCCTNLKGFVGAKWIAIEYVLPVEDVNAYFEIDIQASGDTTLYSEGGIEEKYGSTPEPDKPKKVCLFEVFNKTTQTRCFVVDGYKKYVLTPEPLAQKVYGFWPVKALTFNDIESEPGREVVLFPPSDVELIRHPQKEWNRTREDLRSHRTANIPAYITMKNYLTQADKDKITAAVPNQVIELEASLPQGMTPDQLVAPKTKVPIDPQVYDTTPLQQDVLFSVGAQEANLGQPNPQGTATGQNIAEQSRLTAGNSNVDDLDDLLSWMARVGGEILLQEFSEDSVRRIVGQGAAWPVSPQEREDFLNSIYLVSKAASSGRPNKAVEVQNWQLLAPILQASGANPQFMVRETIRRIDDQIDPEAAFPLMPTQMGQMSGPNGQPSQIPGHDEIPQQSRPGPGQLGPRQENIPVAVG